MNAKALLAIVGLIGCVVSVTPTMNAQSPRSVVLVVDKLAVEDFIDFPEATEPWYELAKEGAVGLMNVRTGGAASSANGYLSLALGQRAVAGMWSNDALLPSEIVQGSSAREVYERLIGQSAEGQALHLGIGQLPRTRYVGDIMKQAGLTTALVGNGDLPGQRTRYGALLAMNRSGSVDLARIDRDVVMDDPSWPSGLRTDYDHLFSALLDVVNKAHWIIVDLRDLARLEEVSSLVDPAHERTSREVALGRLAQFTQRAVHHVRRHHPGTAVYLISPSPSQTLGRQGIALTPVFRWTAEAGPGLLTSATTRRAGIVTNFDFIPGVTMDLSLLPPPSDIAGRPWFVEVREDAMAAILDQYVSIRQVHLQRLPIIQPYFFIVLGIFATGIFLTLAVQHHVIRWSRWRDSLWKALLGAAAAYPGALLLLAAFPPASLYGTTTRLLALLLAVGVLIAFTYHRLQWVRVESIGLITAGMVLLDVVTGASLMQSSLLGYDPIAGSRFYGIGNEYMGVLMGSALMGTAFILQRRPVSKTMLPWPSLVFLGMAFVMAHPGLGINVGGAITAASATWAAFFLIRGRRFTWQNTATGAVMLGIVLTFVGVADHWLFQGNSSHLGRAVASVSASSADPLWDLFARKISMNIRLIRLTIWSRVALGALALLSVLFLWPNWLARSLETTYPWLMRMSRIALISALVALIVNDSGVVAAATLLLWPALAILSLAVELAWQCRVDRPQQNLIG